MSCSKSKVTLIAGGVGGAKMAEGFAALEDVDLSIIGNIADDDIFHGLWVSPDIDTLTYSLAGLIDREQGWGVADESKRALCVLERLGQETWMTLGDRDFGLHIYRTMRRLAGDRPSKIAQDIAERLGVVPRIILPTDDVIQTKVKTPKGWMSFQEYFVKEQCRPDVVQLEYAGLPEAVATAEAIEALTNADLIIIAPSNPLVSIAPIIKIAGITSAISNAKVPVVAVSPLIAGKVVKGPADRMMQSLGMRADVVGVADCYANLVDSLFIDNLDKGCKAEIENFGMDCVCSDILMRDLNDKSRLAREILNSQTPKSMGELV